MKRVRFFILSAIVCLLFITIFSYADNYVSADILCKGDVNSDGSINASDALMVLKHAAKLDEVNIRIADVDEDATVNATDALYILKYAAKLIAEFPGGNTVKPETTPEPTETASPGPEETATPEPTETVSPAPTATPVPVEANIRKVKNEIKAKGYKEDTVYYIPYSVSNDDTLYTFLVYYEDEDLLQFELSYYEEFSAEEASSAGLFLPITGGSVEAFFSVGYYYGDYYDYFDAKATIKPETVSKNSKIAYVKTDSYGVDDAEAVEILTEAETITKDSLLLWNDILMEETGLRLKDLGFANY